MKSKFADLPGGVLFYPCCCHDIMEPITLFADWIEDFWFADVGFHRKGRQYQQGRLKPYDTVFRLKPELKKYMRKTGEKRWKPVPTPFDPARGLSCWTEPLCVSESFERKGDGKPITVHLRGGDARKCLEKHEFEHISVFFYRGDSQGEGGSGLWWLSRQLFTRVLARMPDNAMLATDGSNCRSRHLRPLAQNHFRRDGWEPLKTTSFNFRGRQFALLGEIGKRYGPTYAWRVASAAATAEATWLELRA